MSDQKRIDEATGTDLVGHEWDGIEELNTPLPRWWLWTFIACIVWAIGYTVVYPAWPGLTGATPGTLGWTSRGQLQSEMAAAQAKRGPMLAALAATPVEQLGARPELLSAAIEGGKAAFKVHCVQCHGSGADGIRPGSGYPNLNDDDWLWGGDLASIHFTLTHGIRNPDHAETRLSDMPAYGGMFSPAEMSAVVAHVQTLSGARKADAASQAGAPLFAANCVQCHGPDGKGVRAMGGPNLTDDIWLYGGDTAAIRAQISKPRMGVMPRWNDKLDPATIKMLAAYVHSLGGGEAAPAVAAATEATAN